MKKLSALKLWRIVNIIYYAPEVDMLIENT